MDDIQRDSLNELLRNLLSMQDNVTHCNERGPAFEKETRDLIIERDRIKRSIVNFVDAIMPRGTVFICPDCGYKVQAEELGNLRGS